jgi:hypothetical protein
MQEYITIKDLKKKAKKERKNNNNLKNHSESLNAISVGYNFKNWEELLENSILPLKANKDLNLDEKSIYMIHLLKVIVDNIYNNIRNFHEILESESENVLTNYIHNSFNNYNTSESDFWMQKGIDLIHVISFMFYEKHNKDEYCFNNYYKYLKLEILLEDINKNENLKNNDVIKDFLSNTLVSYINPTSSNPNPEQNETVKEQFGYLSTQYTRTFNVIKDTIEIFNNKKITKKEIIDLLKIKDNLHLLYNNQLLDNKNNFLTYTKNLTGSDYSIYNNEVLAKHIKFLELL